jgi:hypothetical protein
VGLYWIPGITKELPLIELVGIGTGSVISGNKRVDRRLPRTTRKELLRGGTYAH